jgi:glutamine synthetase adenylyltransferase
MTDQPNPTAGEVHDGGARQRAIEAYEGARDRATDTLSQAPLIALAGGLAAGALIAALLPRTDAETRLVRPTARRVKKTASAALDAARDTGSQRLDEMGLNRQKGEDTIRKLLDDLTDAAKASADAALEAARNANES